MQIPIPTTRVQQQELEVPPQLGLPFYGKTLDVNQLCDNKHPDVVQYWGKATHIFDNVYRCLANVGGALCVVEVTITLHDRSTQSHR